jgi:hypothetical protein
VDDGGSGGREEEMNGQRAGEVRGLVAKHVATIGV